MKRIIPLLIMLVMFLVAACGSPAATTTQVSAQPAATEAPAQSGATQAPACVYPRIPGP